MPPEPPTPTPDRDVLERARIERPRRFAVVIHDDDYTTQEFVVALLMRHFGHDPQAAYQRMMEVHLAGRTVAGVYPRDLAESKVARATAEARREGHPLLLTVEPVEDP